MVITLSSIIEFKNISNLNLHAADNHRLLIMLKVIEYSGLMA